MPVFRRWIQIGSLFRIIARLTAVWLPQEGTTRRHQRQLRGADTNTFSSIGCTSISSGSWSDPVFRQVPPVKIHITTCQNKKVGKSSWQNRTKWYNEQVAGWGTHLRVCWNRQTGKLEVLVFDWTCGFKSHHSHHPSPAVKKRRTDMREWWNWQTR